MKLCLPAPPVGGFGRQTTNGSEANDNEFHSDLIRCPTWWNSCGTGGADGIERNSSSSERLYN